MAHFTLPSPLRSTFRLLNDTVIHSYAPARATSSSVAVQTPQAKCRLREGAGCGLAVCPLNGVRMPRVRRRPLNEMVE